MVTSTLNLKVHLPPTESFQPLSYEGGRTITWKPRTATRRVILHDSHTEPEVENAEDYLRFHGRKMGLLDVGYHYLIERSGARVVCRPVRLIGSHTPGHNMDRIGICLIGGMSPTGPVDNFTYQQKIGLAELWCSIEVLYPDIPLVGHSEVQRFVDRRACPAIDMDDLRRDLAFFKSTGVMP